MAKFVPSDALSFDASVNKKDVPYAISYTVETSASEADLTDKADRKIPFGVTLICTFAVCTAAWIGIAYALISLLHH